MNKTTLQAPGGTERAWHLIDVANIPVGRLAAQRRLLGSGRLQGLLRKGVADQWANERAGARDSLDRCALGDVVEQDVDKFEDVGSNGNGNSEPRIASGAQSPPCCLRKSARKTIGGMPTPPPISSVFGRSLDGRNAWPIGPRTLIESPDCFLASRRRPSPTIL